MTVRTTYFGGLGTAAYQPGPTDAVIGVVRRPMEFVDDVVDRNVPAVAPPEPLLDAVKAVEESADRDGHDRPRAVAWRSTDFEARYRAFLDRPGQRQVLDALRERHADHEGDTVLVCYERNPQWCHRRPLADVLAGGLEGVDVVHHPEPDPDPEDGPDGDAGDEDGSDEPAVATLSRWSP